MRMLRIAQAEELIDALDLEEVQTGTGQNQEMALGRPCDTRWGSHFRTVNRVLSLYAAIKSPKEDWKRVPWCGGSSGSICGDINSVI